MKAKFMDTMAIRLPKATIEHLRKLKGEKQLSSMSVALKYWIEQEYNARVETQLFEIKEKLEDLHKTIKTVNRRTFALVYDKVMDDLKKVARVVGLSPQEMQDYFDLREEEIIKLVYAYPATKNYCSLLSELKEEMLSSEK